MSKRPAYAGRSRIGFGHILLVLSGMLLMALIQSVFFRHPAKLPLTAKAPPPAQTRKPAWGEVSYTPLGLQRPEQHFNRHLDTTRTPWVFRNETEQSLGALFAGIEMDATAREFLTNSANWEKGEGTFKVLAPLPVVIGLTANGRAKLYAHLSRTPDNIPQRIAFQFRASAFDEWFGESGLSREKVDLVKKLTYQQGNIVCFADTAVFAEVSTPAETLSLVKALWRVSTFIMNVKIDRDTDVDALLNYWAKGSRAYEYKPLIDSMTRLDEGAVINVSYFLPPFARLRLYTYPHPENPQSPRQDCFWSSMNFFSFRPDDRFFTPEETMKTLAQDYVMVTDVSKEFGDTLMLISRTGQALHMCVYIADDVVFTKNGASVAQPWVLMKMDEMLGWYESEHPYSIVTYRRKVVPGYAPTSLSQSSVGRFQ